MIPQSFIQDLLTRIDILEVVGNRVQLKKKGANFWACCPFHSEKTPSFSVNPARQFYHCFGCGRSGSAISFLMDYSGLTYPEAIEELARSIGVPVPNDGPQISKEQRAEKQAKTLALTEVMSCAEVFYRKQLRGAVDAIDYLKGRGLTGEVAARFGLGFAPDSWTSLDQCFERYDAKELTESGLVIDRSDEEGGRTKRYDRFRGRIMFPIRNERGQVIAFGGRVMDKSEPKYLNSPETPLFSKGNELYGLFEARMAIREAKCALVVEGYMDVVALSQLGFPQAVATLGTACTEMHVRKLFRHTNHIIFSFDGDTAGRNAARRALESSLKLVDDERRVSFLFLPAEHDPDSFVREFGHDAFQQAMAGAMPLSSFLMQEILNGADLSTMEGRAAMLSRAKPWCSVMKRSALQVQVVRKLIDLAKMPENDVLPLLGFTPRKASGNRQNASGWRQPGAVGNGFQGNGQRRPNQSLGARSRMPELTWQVLRMLVRFPGLAQTLHAEDIETIAGDSGEGYALFKMVTDQIDSLGAGGQQDVQYAALVEVLRASGLPHAEQLVRETLDDGFNEVMAAAQLRGAIRQMRFQQIDRRMADLLSTKEGDWRAEYRQLQAERDALQNQSKQENEQAWNRMDSEGA